MSTVQSKKVDERSAVGADILKRRLAAQFTSVTISNNCSTYLRELLSCAALTWEKLSQLSAAYSLLSTYLRELTLK